MSDIDIFESICMHRNELAHEPISFLTSHNREFDIEKFSSLVELFKKIEK